MIRPAARRASRYAAAAHWAPRRLSATTGSSDTERLASVDASGLTELTVGPALDVDGAVGVDGAFGVAGGLGWPGGETTVPRISRRRRLLRRRMRQWAAAICFGLAVWAGLQVMAPSPPSVEEVAVLVVTRDLPTGSVLGSADLAVTTRPRQWAPPEALSEPAAALGRALSGPLAEGEPVTDRRLVGAGLLRGQPADTVAVSVPLADAGARSVVRPGDRVRLLRPGTGAVVATGVVLVQPAVGDPGPLGVAGGPHTLVLALTGAEASAVAAAMVPDGLGVASGGGFLVAVTG